MSCRIYLMSILSKAQARNFNTGSFSAAIKNETAKGQKKESERMKEFRNKLKSDVGSGDGARIQFGDRVLVGTDPKNGGAVTSSEQDPTKWGDWQNGGRVSDF